MEGRKQIRIKYPINLGVYRVNWPRESNSVNQNTKEKRNSVNQPRESSGECLMLGKGYG